MAITRAAYRGQIVPPPEHPDWLVAEYDGLTHHDQMTQS
jgi:hypothetical protein